MCTAAALTAVLIARPLRPRSATLALGAAIWVAALCPGPGDIPAVLRAGPNGNLLILQASATLATVALLLVRRAELALLACAVQGFLWWLGATLRDSSYDLVAAQVIGCGILLGATDLRARPATSSPEPIRGSWSVRQDAGIFVAGLVLAALMSHWAFGGFIFNGDEVANTFQADVYGHLRAYAPVPPCPSMFENYWVFRHEGRAFSQYTPGWPLFMAPFSRLGIVGLAGPTMAGIFAVGIARLSRRVAGGLGGTVEEAARIVRLVGPLGAAVALLGPSMLLNGASRFSHTMVCACFAWSVESACVLSDAPSRSRAWGYGSLLGAATAFGLATRPADGGLLGLPVFVYFASAVLRRRVGWRALLATTLAFLLVSGLTLVILRLQLGKWFETAYALSSSIHPEAGLKLSAPAANEVRIAIPLAVGAFCWFPSALALALAHHVRALAGPERRVALMLVGGTMTLMGFYSFVEFGRQSYDGLGPRYELPTVVMLAPGTAALLAPVLRGFARALWAGAELAARLRAAIPATLALGAFAVGITNIAPLVYPLAREENVVSTAPLRAAAKLGLSNAIVLLSQNDLITHRTNVAQNAPFDPHPDVLFLGRESEADEACARKHFPGRTWYRAQRTEKLLPY